MRRTARAATALVSNHGEDESPAVLDALVAGGEADEFGDHAETNGQSVATSAPAQADANPRTESLLSVAISEAANDAALAAHDLEDDGTLTFRGEVCAVSNFGRVVVVSHFFTRSL